MRLDRRFQFVLLYIERIILFKTTSIVERVDRYSNKCRRIVDAISRYNYKRLLEILDNYRFGIYNRQFYKSINTMRN